MKGKNKFYWLGLVCLLAAVLVLFVPVAEQTVLAPDFSVTYLDVGQGDSIYLNCGEYNILIDGGGSPRNIVGMGEKVVVPFLKSRGISKLDLVFNTHPDADHIGGLFPVLDQIPVDKLVMYPNYEAVNLRQKMEALAKNKKVPVDLAVAGDVYEFPNGLKISVVAPTKDEYFADAKLNNGSLVLQISYGDFDLLTTGDLQGKEVDAVLEKLKKVPNSDAPVDIDGDGILEFTDFEAIQIPHHGSKHSFDPSWYTAFCPDAVLISVGANNSYGHPYSKITDYWQQNGAKVFRTDLDGAITIKVKDDKVYYSTVAN